MPKKYIAKVRDHRLKNMYLWKELVITRQYKHTAERSIIDIDSVDDIKRIIKELNKLVEVYHG